MAPSLPPVSEIEQCNDATGRLLAAIAEMTDDEARSPSQLPDWTRAHVLSHLVGNADSIVRRLTASRAGRIVDQYLGGLATRRAEIERGARRPAIELIENVQRSAHEVEAIFAAYPEDAWERPVRSVDGRERPAWTTVVSRWHEVEAHHVDLDFGYRAGDWPPALVEARLPREINALAGRTDPNELLAWLLGRGPAPALEVWG